MVQLNQLLGGLMGGSGGGASPIQGILMNMLGSQAGGHGAPGGLGGLLTMFQQAGLGDVAQSWVGNGPNQPVSPQQLHSALGDEQVQSMATQSGLAPQDFLSQLRVCL